MHLEVAVCLPRDAETVPLVRGVVTGALDTFGVVRDCVDDIGLAISEACTNVVQHADADDEYEVRLEVDDQSCAISVRNTGEGFDAGTLTDVLPDPASPRGRGVHIMRAVMDRVQFRSEPANGTIVHLVKSLRVDDGGPFARLQVRASVRP